MKRQYVEKFYFVILTEDLVSDKPIINFRALVKKSRVLVSADAEAATQSQERPKSLFSGGGWEAQRLAIIKKYEAADYGDEDDDDSSDEQEDRLERPKSNEPHESDSSEKSSSEDQKEYYDSDDSMIDDYDLAQKKKAQYFARQNTKRTKHGAFYVSNEETISFVEIPETEKEIVDEDSNGDFVNSEEVRRKRKAPPQGASTGMTKRATGVGRADGLASLVESVGLDFIQKPSPAAAAQEFDECMEALEKHAWPKKTGAGAETGAEKEKQQRLHFPTEIENIFYRACVLAQQTRGVDVDKFLKDSLQFVPFAPKTLKKRYQRCHESAIQENAKKKLTEMCGLLGTGGGAIEIEEDDEELEKYFEIVILIADSEDRLEKIMQKKNKSILSDLYTSQMLQHRDLLLAALPPNSLRRNLLFKRAEKFLEKKIQSISEQRREQDAKLKEIQASQPVKTPKPVTSKASSKPLQKSLTKSPKPKPTPVVPSPPSPPPVVDISPDAPPSGTIFESIPESLYASRLKTEEK